MIEIIINNQHNLFIPFDKWNVAKEMLFVLSIDITKKQGYDSRDHSKIYNCYETWLRDWQLRSFIRENLGCYQTQCPNLEETNVAYITLVEGVNNWRHQITIDFESSEEPDLSE